MVTFTTLAAILPLDAASHQDELDHLPAGVLDPVQEGVDRVVDLAPVQLLAAGNGSRDVLVLVDGAQVHVEVALVGGQVLDRRGAHRGGSRRLGLGGERRAVRAHLGDLPAQEPVDVLLADGDAGGHEDILPVDIDRLVEHHPVAKLSWSVCSSSLASQVHDESEQLRHDLVEAFGDEGVDIKPCERIGQPGVLDEGHAAFPRDRHDGLRQAAPAACHDERGGEITSVPQGGRRLRIPRHALPHSIDAPKGCPLPRRGETVEQFPVMYSIVNFHSHVMEFCPQRVQSPSRGAPAALLVAEHGHPADLPFHVEGEVKPVRGEHEAQEALRPAVVEELHRAREGSLHPPSVKTNGTTTQPGALPRA